MLTRQDNIRRVCRIEGKYEFSSADSFPFGLLPTKRDVLKRLLFFDNWRTAKAAADVANELYDHWVYCNVYPITKAGIKNKVKKLAKDLKHLESYPAAKRGPTFDDHVKTFMNDRDKIFDVFCRDPAKLRKQEEAYKLKMTDADHAFYEDQCGPRQGKCLSIKEDLSPADHRFMKRTALKEKVQSLASASSPNTIFDEREEYNDECLSVISSSSSSSLATASVGSSSLPKKKQKLSSQNRVPLENLAMLCERFEISDRAGAAIATATLKDFGVITENETLVIDRSKLRRERNKYRLERQKEEESLYQLVDALFVDGRKDATMTCTQSEDGKSHPSINLEEHYVLVGEPGEYYLTHVTPLTGTGKEIAQSIYNAIQDTNLAENLNILGSDGTAVMTGCITGCITSLEEMLGRPLQWTICLLHCNELPLRHVFKTLDGITKSPDSFSGVIGQQLTGSVSNWGVAEFRPIPNPSFPLLSNDTVQDLSSDQYYAYRISMAVTLGTVDKDLELLEVGGISHARWLTLACRILRLYVAVSNPSHTLSRLAEFIIKVYLPSWFEIKLNNCITDGPRNFFNILDKVNKFPDQEIRTTAIKVLKRNAFAAHQENVLLAMLADEDESVRRVAVNKIKAVRQESTKSPTTSSSTKVQQKPTSVRKFRVPSINEKAKSYQNLVSIDKTKYQPPAIRNMTTDELEEIRSSKLQILHPCHNQAVERHIKLVTEASAMVSGYERRDGMIRQKIRSRKLMKSFNTKSQFKS